MRSRGDGVWPDTRAHERRSRSGGLGCHRHRAARSPPGRRAGSLGSRTADVAGGHAMASLKYSFVFGVFAALLTVLALQLRGLGWGLLWPALSFALVAVAYAGAGPA